jgi:uncharacterized protein YndB with AHSA1/START domain
VPDITQMITVHASPARVYEALTTAEAIRGWWTQNAFLDAKVGGTGVFDFSGHTAPTKVTIEALAPPVRVAWKTLSSFHPEWLGTTISFDLAPAGADTALVFNHRGFRHADNRFDLFTKGWAHYLSSLKTYLETGKGAPHA